MTKGSMDYDKALVPSFPFSFKFSVNCDVALKSRLGVELDQLYIATTGKVVLPQREFHIKALGIDEYIDARDIIAYPYCPPN